jgi:hypothetical protein
LIGNPAHVIDTSVDVTRSARAGVQILVVAEDARLRRVWPVSEAVARGTRNSALFVPRFLFQKLILVKNRAAWSRDSCGFWLDANLAEETGDEGQRDHVEKAGVDFA